MCIPGLRCRRDSVCTVPSLETCQRPGQVEVRCSEREAETYVSHASPALTTGLCLFQSSMTFPALTNSPRPRRSTMS